MVYISALGNGINFKSATYNAVKIQINDPKTNISECCKGASGDNGVYNAVNIEVNRPSVEAVKPDKHSNCYEHPYAECAVNSNFAPIHPVKVPNLPVLPVAYQTTNFINNRTLINAEVDKDSKLNSNKVVSEEKKTKNPEAVMIITEEIVAVPSPRLTKVEEQKTAYVNNNNGVNFKSKSEIEIIPPVEIKPDVDISRVISNLSDSDFDVQAKQMEEIAKVSMENSEKAVSYIVTEVFSELINIVKLDSSELAPPSEKQIELRKQIIINEIIKEQAKLENKEISSSDLPYKITERDLRQASKLSTMEQAERNKEYALYTIAILAKLYSDEVNKLTGNVVPLTDLPGVSNLVDSLRYESNPAVKIASLDALRYIARDEYKDELATIFRLVTNDSNSYVARNAALALESLY